MATAAARNAEPKGPKEAPHVWIMATNIPVTEKEMRNGMMRGVLHLATRTKVEVIDGYCKHCRRPYDDVGDEACVYALGQNEHLRGGPIGERKKRTKPSGPSAQSA